MTLNPKIEFLNSLNIGKVQKKCKIGPKLAELGPFVKVEIYLNFLEKLKKLDLSMLANGAVLVDIETIAAVGGSMGSPNLVLRWEGQMR